MSEDIEKTEIESNTKNSDLDIEIVNSILMSRRISSIAKHKDPDDVFPVEIGKDESTMTYALKRYIIDNELSLSYIKERYRMLYENTNDNNFNNFKSSLSNGGISSKTEKKWLNVLGLKAAKVVLESYT